MWDNVEMCDRIGHNTINNISLVTSRTSWNARVFGQFISVDRSNKLKNDLWQMYKIRTEI